MDVDFDQFCNGRHAGPLATATGRAVLDWDGLVARLAAAHAARGILTSGSNSPTANSAGTLGSFAPGFASQIAHYRATASRSPGRYPCGDINQNAKVDGKPTGAIADNSRGQTLTVVRGPS